MLNQVSQFRELNTRYYMSGHYIWKLLNDLFQFNMKKCESDLNL